MKYDNDFEQVNLRSAYDKLCIVLEQYETGYYSLEDNYPTLVEATNLLGEVLGE